MWRSPLYRGNSLSDPNLITQNRKLHPMKNKHSNLIIAYLSSGKSLIGYLDHKNSDDSALILKTVGEFVDTSEMVPGVGSQKIAYIIGIGSNIGPVHETPVRNSNVTHILEITMKNLGPAAYDRTIQGWENFVNGGKHDEVSKLDLPTTEETANIRAGLHPKGLVQ